MLNIEQINYEEIVQSLLVKYPNINFCSYNSYEDYFSENEEKLKEGLLLNKKNKKEIKNDGKIF